MKVIACLRSFIAYILVGLYFSVWSLVTLPLLWIVGLFSKKARDRAVRAIAMTALRIITAVLGVKARVIGFENIPAGTAAFISNHKSFFDMICVYPIMKRPLGFVAKKEFASILPFRIWLLWLGCIFVDRKNPREGMKSINAAAEKIKNGTSMWICPEGTRVRHEGLGDFHEGSFKIADKAGCKVVPVTFIHMEECYEKQSPLILPTKPIIVFGKPVDTAGLDREGLRAVHQQVEDEIKHTYEQYVTEPFR